MSRTYLIIQVQHLKVLPCSVQVLLSDQSDLREAALEAVDASAAEGREGAQGSAHQLGNYIFLTPLTLILLVC